MCQSTNKGGVIRLRAAGCEVTGCIGRKPGAFGNHADHVGLDLDSGRGRCPSRELRIERCRDTIRPLRRHRRCRIEQSEISRMRYVNDAVLHLRDRPGQKIVRWARLSEDKGCKFGPEPGNVERWRNRAPGNPLMRGGEFSRQDVIPTFAKITARKQQ